MFFRNINIELLPLEYEYKEIAIVEVPDSLKSYGITVVDGPFFSLMPYPALNKHSLYHVEHSKHYSWNDTENDSIHKKENLKSKFNQMLKDSAKYLPEISKTKYIKSFYETKTNISPRNNELLQCDVFYASFRHTLKRNHF